MMGRFVFVVAAFAAICGSAETLGFWDFRDGDPGSDVATIANSAGSGSYVSAPAKKTGNNGTSGVLPKFNADSPGKIYGGKHGELLSANPQSIDFRYISRDSQDTRQGGYIDLDGVADAISGNGSFTIEYFFKMNEDYVYWQSGDGTWDNRSKTMLYLESRTGYGAFKQIIPTAVIQDQDASGHAQGVSLEIYKHDPVAAGNPAFSGDLCDGKWHHIAIVYTQTNDVTKAGQIVLFYDGANSSTVPYLNDPEDTTGLKLRIGTGYKNQDGADKTGTEPVNASISALRVSSGALAKDDFLQVDTLPDIAGMGTAAYYTFMDGAAGENVGTVTNTVQAGLMTGKAAITWNGSSSTGEMPKFSSDVPARWIYTDASQQTLLTDSYQSIYCRPVQDYTMGGGRVDFEAASTLAHRLDAFTFEYFFKIPEDQTHAYRTPFGYQFGGREDLKINMQGYSAATGYNNYACEVRTNSTTWTTVASTALVSANLQYGWHHAAFVYTKSDNRVDLYLDKTKFGSLHYTNHIGLASFPFRLGSSANQEKAITEACGGYFACPRLSTSALSADQFMTASDWTDRYTVFTISFNEGQGKDGQAFVSSVGSDALAYAKFPDRQVPLRVRYCLHSAVYPQFVEGAAARAGRKVLWGAEPVWENLAGCHFLGYASLASGTSNRNYTGAELCVPGSAYAAQNPESWTMEAFVRPEYDSLDSALLFGKAAIANQHANPKPYPQYCWMLTRNKDGKLKLSWTEQAADPSYEYTSASTAYYKSATTATAVMDRHRWYHVALTYDKPTKTFKLYVNYSPVLTQATSGLELFDSTHDYFFSRIDASYGFEGWMDEIRFSSTALQPESFVTLEPLGMFMLFR